ncbi:damage-control phosphatase ARMT1-like [Asterias amurensis]|uniref:damage-control phosphatase ARMT1-like n=1 Tax=Asterias amurensis TaxID=7602 RepID=UPI003AB48647
MTATSSDENDGLPPRLSARFEGSFAYLTIKDRLPVITTKVVNTVYTYRIEAAQLHGQDGATDCKDIVAKLSKFRNELQTDKAILPLQPDGEDDIEIWERCLEEETKANGGTPASWFTSPWLYVECYMYRRIVNIIRQSNHLRKFDPFSEQKKAALKQSQEALVILAEYQKMTHGKGIDCFKEFMEISLWGNKCDLSISAGVENSQKISPLAQLANLRNKILVNDSDKLWRVLQNSRESKAENEAVRMDIVLDNAGFELFTDLCLAEYILRTNLADVIVMHYKAMPWFVSDVGQDDFSHTLNYLEHQENDSLKKLGRCWSQRINTKSWVLQGHPFWTTPHDFSAMQSVAPDLYSELAKSDLILLKGDLNYRKLVGDRQWEPTIPYVEALCGFHPAPHCALRTCKADVIVGLDDGVAEQTAAEDRDWLIDGKFAVIQFSGMIRT